MTGRANDPGGPVRSGLGRHLRGRRSRSIAVRVGEDRSERELAARVDLLELDLHLLAHAQDVLDAMLGPGVKRIEHSGARLDAGLAAVLAAVDAGESSCDGVAAALGLPGPEIAAALARLEVLGYVSCSAMGLYSRTLLQVDD